MTASTGRFQAPSSIEGSNSDGEVIATVNGVPAWVPSSVPMLLLPAGSNSATVAALDSPAGTIPYGTIVLPKA